MDYLFAISIMKIVWIDVLLSGDNALVIAMAVAALPDRQRLWATVLGAGAAIALRIFITGSVSYILEIPYLRAIGGLALMAVAIKLLVPDDCSEEEQPPFGLLKAIVTVVVADVSMSIDNVIAVAAAANGSQVLIAIGLGLSIPFIITGASVISMVLERLPILLWAGSALLGYIAGETIVSDPIVGRWLSAPFDWPVFWGVIGAASAILGAALWNYSSTEWSKKDA